MKRDNIPDADYIRRAEATGEPWPDYSDYIDEENDEDDYQSEDKTQE